MNRKVYIFLIILISFVLFSYSSHTPGFNREEISARVLSVSDDGLEIIINRGTIDNIDPKTECIIRPNRGDGSAQIQWDIYFAKGKITEVDERSARILITDSKDTILPGDYCEVYGEVPAHLIKTDLGRIALFDIVFLDYSSGLPFFTLGDLILDPTQEQMDRITTQLIEEVHLWADEVDTWSKGVKVQGGIFSGLSWGEALKKTGKKEMDTFLEFVSYFPGKYINFDWTFIEIYTSWVISETLTGTREKHFREAAPFADEGDELVTEGKYQKGIEAYKKALDILPDYEYVKKRLTLVNSMLKHIKIIEDDPLDVIAHYNLGTEFYDLNLNEKALEQFLDARNLGYENQSLIKFLGYTYTAMEQYSSAREIFEQLNKELPRDKNILKWLRFVTAREAQAQKESAESYVLTGDLRYRWGDYDDAITEYKKALELNPNSQKIWNLILNTTKRRDAYQHQQWALDYWENGNFIDARTYWDEAIAICEAIQDKESVKEILIQIADKMYDWSFYNDAIDVYKQVLEIDPGHYASYISLSNCYKANGDYEEAIRWVEKGILVDPGDAWGYNILGYIYLKQKDLSKSIDELKKAIQLDSRYKYPNYNLASAYVLKGNFPEARNYLERALEIDKDYWDARNDLVAIECIFETTRLLELNSNNLTARLRYARSLFDLNDYDASIKELNRALKMKRNNAKVLKYLGYAYTRKKEYKEGHDYLTKAYNIDPSPDLASWILYNEAQSLLEKDPQDPEGYMKLGDDDLYWQYYDDALVDFENAQNKGADPQLVFKKMEIARTGKEAKKYYDISSEYFDRGDYEKSLSYAEEAFKLYEKIDSQDRIVWALLRMGWCYASLYKHDKALEKYKQAGILAKQVGDDVLYAHYVSSMGDYYKNIGDFESALDYKQQAQELYHNNNDLINEASLTLSSIGSIFGTMGEFDTMIEYYERALAIHVNAKNYSGEASALNDLGGAYVDDGDYSKALEMKMKALKTAQDYNDTWTELWAYRGIGDIYFDLGDSHNAGRSFNYFLSIATALGSKPNRAIALNDLGRVYLEFDKDYDKAFKYFSESNNLALLSGYTLMEGVAQANIGVVYSRKGEYKKALEYHDKGLSIVRSLKDKYTEMQGLSEKGETLMEMKRYTEALECHLTSITLCESIGNMSEKWKYEFKTGKTYEFLGKSEDAIEYYKKAISTLSGIKKKIKSDALKKGFSDQDSQIEVYKRLIDLLINNGREKEALTYIEESKSKIIKDSFGDVKPITSDKDLNQTLSFVDKIEKKKEALERQLFEERKKPEQEQDRTKIEILSNTLATTEGEFNQWMLKLKFQNRKMYDALTINPTTLGDIQNEIPDKTLIVEYFISTDQLYIFCIGKQYFFAKSIDISEKILEKEIVDFVNYCKSPQPKNEKKLENQGIKLYKILIRPVEEQIDNYENIVIVPFGSLYYLPFHALIRKEGNKKEYFIERKRISYTTSATFSDVLKNTSKKLEGIFALGNPDGSLPSAAREVELLKSNIFKDKAHIWTEGEATKSNFINHAKEYNIIHLATHGVIQNNPLESYLLFAGVSEEEKRLTLLEVAGYTALREHTGLVFLSACQTAMDSSGGNGSELISLAEAFAMAGPPTLIASLWEVNDNSTHKLVLKFYNDLMSKKMDKLEALRNAQKMLINDKDFSHPYFWAPFIMLGNWR
ncbi:MAG: tetratricopeptide repeat protein [Spirochaetales bacterium]|nr:tetratricopeptide repeat protein [Spirochaetales bacterium]